MRHLVGKKMGQVIFKTWIQKEVISILLRALSRFRELLAHTRGYFGKYQVLMFALANITPGC